MLEFCRKTGRNLSTKNDLPLPIVDKTTNAGKPRPKASHTTRKSRPHSGTTSLKTASRRYFNRPLSEWSGISMAVLSAQIEQTFKRLSSTPAYRPPSSTAPHDIEKNYPVPLSASPTRQPRKVLVPKGSARRSSTLVLPILEFPAEIRLQIYSNFLLVPPEKVWQQSDQKAQDERVLIKLTRKNLRRVCHQISGEWDPLFFSTTTLTVRNTLPGWDSLSAPSIQQNRAMVNFGDMWHKGTGMIYNLPQTRPMGSALLQTVFLEKQPRYTLNKVRRLQYIISGSSLNSMDLDDLESFAKVLQATKEEALQSLEEVAICYRPLRLVRGFVKLDNVWEKSSEATYKWDIVKNLFQPEGGLGCFGKWTTLRRICFDKNLVGGQSARFVLDLKVYELQLVFRKSQKPSTAVNPEWVELPGI